MGTNITLASSKGGAGKTTIAEIIVGSMCARKRRVAVIDADYNRSLANWVERFQHPATVFTELDEEKLFRLAADAAEDHDIGVIDTAGAAGRTTMFAMAQSNLVIVPVKPSEQDIREAAKTIDLVKEAASISKRDIRAYVLVNDCKPGTVVARHVDQQILMLGLPAFETKLEDLVAFQEMSFNGRVPSRGAAGLQVRKLLGELAEFGVLDFEEESWLQGLMGRKVA